MHHPLTSALAFILATALASPLQAADGQTPEAASPSEGHREALGARLSLDVEVDPIAYALKGHSVHVGLRLDRYRADLGAFALAMPEAFHGNPGMDASFAGFGLKLDRSFWEDGDWVFVGLEAGLNTLTVSSPTSEAFNQSWQGTAGVRTGLRIPLPKGFYVAPWVGVGVNLGDKEIVVGEETFAVANTYIFPTVHLGWRGR